MIIRDLVKTCSLQNHIKTQNLGAFSPWSEWTFTPSDQGILVSRQITLVSSTTQYLLPTLSCAIPDLVKAWQCSLKSENEEQGSSLLFIGNQKARPNSTSEIQHHGDFWTVRAGLRHFEISFFIKTQACISQIQDTVFLFLSTQNKTNTNHALQAASSKEIISHNLDGISQMIQDTPEKRRICSVCSTAMLLNFASQSNIYSTKISQLMSMMHDPLWKIYGVWPRAIWAMNQNGYNGFISFCNDQKKFYELLLKHPIAASISFAKGELVNSPLSATPGHLVVIAGIDSIQKKIGVYDPSASHSESSYLEYDFMQFWQAWQNNNNVYYSIF